jgi:hypothetical protein
VNIRRKIIAFVIAILVHFIALDGVQAQDVKAVSSDQETMERLNFISRSLLEGESNATLWYWSWTGLFCTSTVTQLSLFFAVDIVNPGNRDHFRQDQMTGVITSAIGVIGMAFTPMVPSYALDRYKNMPEETPEERIAKLREAEYWLKKSSEREENGRSWISHTMNFAINLAAGLTIWLGFNRPLKDGLITFVPGILVGELQICTVPNRATYDLRAYKRRYMAGTMPKRDDDTNWFFSVCPGGIVAGLHF